MELHFTPEQEAQLAQVAQHAGKPVEQCLTDAALAMLHERYAFLAAVKAQSARLGAATQERNSLFLRVARLIPCPFCAGSSKEGIAAAERAEFVDDDEVRHWLEERERS
ncbi:MAG: hypothetical protein WA324_02275 [Bryobacteraceae bacterium]